MNYPNRNQFLQALKNQIEENILHHCLAVESCMGAIFDYLKTNNQLTEVDLKKEDWLLAGLIHDIDYSGEYKAFHPNKTLEVLARYDLTITKKVHNIIRAHAPEKTGYQPKNKSEWSIFCADSLTGLIVATALVYPSKKLADVKLSSILKRFREPRFAAGIRREDIIKCENKDGLNLSLEKLTEICFEAMRERSLEIGV